MTYLKHPVSADRPARIALIGAGWIGGFHAESVARADQRDAGRPVSGDRML